MTRLEKRYMEAEGAGAEVFDLRLEKNYAVSAPDGVIALDTKRIGSERLEAVVLAHELGHVTTGAFYTDDAPCTQRGRSECRAERAAYRRLVPFDELIAALESGVTEPWELAERFDVTEDFVRKALGYYFEEV